MNKKKLEYFLTSLTTNVVKGMKRFLLLLNMKSFSFFQKFFLTLEKNSDENDPTLKTSDSVEPKTVLQDLRINRIF